MSKRLVLGFVTAIVGTFLACGGGKNIFGNPDATGDSGEAGAVDVSLTFPETSTSDAPAQTHCSGDLHSILDDKNQVIQTCQPDQGCGPGGCEPACQSAADNKSTIGCDYYAVAPDAIPEAQGGCFAAYIANTWGVPITINGSYNGKTINMASSARITSGKGASITYSPLPNGQLPANQVAIVFLSQSSTPFESPRR